MFIIAMESSWQPQVCTVALKAPDGPGTVASTQMASISLGTPLLALDLCGHALQAAVIQKLPQQLSLLGGYGQEAKAMFLCV